MDSVKERHTLDLHLKNVQKLCRICANKFKGGQKKGKKERTYKVSSQIENIKSVYGISVHNDKSFPNKFPKLICSKCQRQIYTCLTTNNAQNFLKQNFKHYQDINDKWVQWEQSRINDPLQNCL